ncbi:MAG TPA: tetratricopeptide repeat protein, partial [Candidatus Binatia bacterium]|nr:tetratricopeptide repeat protein [Candidatus Binatia bacterium]
MKKPTIGFYRWAIFGLLALPALLYASEAQNAFNEGVNFYRAGKYKEAVGAFSRAIKVSPKADEAYNNRGLSHFKLGQIDEAIKDYDEALKLNPKLTDAYFNRGNARSAQKQYERALADFDEVLKLDP